jgi:cysteine-S-conjugate beta-lyase
MINSPERRGSDSIKWGLYEEDVLPLWVADMDFTSPPAVLEALKHRVDHGVFGYAFESRELKEIIAERMEARYGWKVRREEIILLPGVVPAINLVCQAVTQPGESVLIQSPVYPPFFQAPLTAGARVTNSTIEVDASGEYSFDSQVFEAGIEEDTRCFVLCNPHNPIGKVYSREDLSAMADVCLRHGLTICSDEIHSDLIFDGYQHAPIASIDPEVSAATVTLLAPSKTYNIAGLECSAMICQNPDLRGRLIEARRGLLGGVNLLGQVAAIAAYREGGDWLREILVILENNRNLLLNFLRDRIPGIRMVKPQATYLAWLDCRDLGLGENPAQFFLKKARVALNNGEDFGEAGKGFVRLNFGCPPERLIEALERMAAAVN